MSTKGHGELHRFAQSMVGAFLLSLDGLTQSLLREPAKEFLASERCASLVDQFVQILAQEMATELAHERRADPFCRLLCHPLTDLLASGALARSLLGNYFSFLHLVLGDAQDEMTTKCQAIVDEIKT